MKQVLGVEVQPTVVKEPVMDVPAIDMTDVAVPSKKASAPARRKSTKRSRPSRRQPSPATAAKVQAKRTRDGSVGRETFAQVEALLKQGKTKAEAFKQIADATGRNSGTVAANYYRVVRSGGAAKPGKARGKASPASATRGRGRAARSDRGRSGAQTGSGVEGVDQVVARLVASVAELTEAVKAQDAEVRELRGRLDSVRGLLG